MIQLDFWQAGIFVFCALALIQSLFLATVLGIKARSNSTLIYLMIVLVGLGMRIGKSIFSHIWVEKVYWGVWLGCIGLWLISAGLHCYTKRLGANRIGVLDKLMFLPALALLLAYGSLDLEMINWAYRLGTPVLAVVLIFHFLNRPKSSSTAQHNTLTGTLAVITLAFVVQLLTGTIAWYVAGSVVSCGALYFLNFSIIRNDLLLRRGKQASISIEPKTLHEVMRKMKKLFDEEEYYKQKGLTISTLADRIQTPAYLISEAIKQDEKRNFNHWVNSFRVAAVINALRNPNRNDKVEFLAEEFGFSGVSSLYQAFKQETGKTIKAYKDELPESNSSL